MSWLRKSSDTTDHRYVEERLSAYLDGELSAREQKAVDHHLTTCHACRWHLDTLRQTVQWTSELPTIPVPRVFTVPAPARREPALGRVPAPPRRWGFAPVLQGATALVALLLVFVVAGDLLFTSVLAPGESQQPLLGMEAPAAVEMTQVAVVREDVAAEAVIETVVVEKEVEVMEAAPAVEAEIAVEEAVSDAASSPLPQAAPPTGESRAESGAPPQAEKAAVAPTPSPEGTRMGAMGLEPPAEGEGEASPDTPMPAATASATATVAFTVEPTVTLRPTEPQPPLPATAVPSAVARTEDRPGAPDERGQWAAGTSRRPAISGLRVFELSLAVVLIVLGTITAFVTMQRRRPR